MLPVCIGLGDIAFLKPLTAVPPHGLPQFHLLNAQCVQGVCMQYAGLHRFLPGVIGYDAWPP